MLGLPRRRFRGRARTGVESSEEIGLVSKRHEAKVGGQETRVGKDSGDRLSRQAGNGFLRSASIDPKRRATRSCEREFPSSGLPALLAPPCCHALSATVRRCFGYFCILWRGSSWENPTSDARGRLVFVRGGSERDSRDGGKTKSVDLEFRPLCECDSRRLCLLRDATCAPRGVGLASSARGSPPAFSPENFQLV